MTYKRLHLESDGIWMLMEWYCLRLREGKASSEGALMRICAQSIAPIMFGSLKVHLNIYLFDSGVWELDVPWLIN